MPPTRSNKKNEAAVTGEDQDDERNITAQELENILKVQLEAQTAALLSKIDELRKEVTATRDIADHALMRVEQCEGNIEILRSENLALRDRIENLQTSRIKNLEELVEERTNRQLRNTLIFKGIPEKHRESWQQSEDLLVEAIENVGIAREDAVDMIERAHRGANTKKQNDNNSPRPIYARFYSWKDSERVKSLFIGNIGSGSKIFAEQKYGPLTMKRRNLALIRRKSLKSEGKITRAFIKFPAKLMAKLSNDPHEKYQCIEDFSTEDVSNRNSNENLSSATSH